jgi:type IV pilus assembly protein PilV
MKHRSENGFTLIEVLVSMIILSIGLLVLVAMQLTAMQNTQGGYLRAQASMVAYDIMDRMRANIPAVTNGDYDLAIEAPAPDIPACTGALANCARVEMANFDLGQWRTMAGIYLPAGNGSVTTVDNTGTTQVTVNLVWTDPYSADGGAETMALVTELPQ